MVQKLIKNQQRRGLDMSDLFIKSLINFIYKDNFDDISDGIMNFKSVSRLIFISGSLFLINPYIGLISVFANKVISNDVNSSYENQVLGSYHQNLEKIKTKLKKENISDDERRQLNNAKTHTEDQIYRLESYFDQMRTKLNNNETKADKLDIDEMDWSDLD